MDLEIKPWTSRILENGRLGATCKEPWKLNAYEQYETCLRCAEYPCFFGQTAEIRGEMLYTFVTRCSLDGLATNLREFVR